MAAWKNSKLMTFDSQNLHVKTHFNDQLVALLREVCGCCCVCTSTGEVQEVVPCLRHKTQAKPHTETKQGCFYDSLLYLLLK
jgi:hypothetical protein